jgi:hypothetical protein
LYTKRQVTGQRGDIALERPSIHHFCRVALPTVRARIEEENI